jgi:hypothetical protein
LRCVSEGKREATVTTTTAKAETSSYYFALFFLLSVCSGEKISFLQFFFIFFRELQQQFELREATDRREKKCVTFGSHFSVSKSAPNRIGNVFFKAK